MSGDPLARKTALENRIGRDFRLRLVSALVLAPIALAITWFGGFPFAAMVCAGSALFLYEWIRITTKIRDLPSMVLPILFVVLGVVLTGMMRIELAVGGFGAAILAAAVMPRFAGCRKWLVTGIVYVSVSALALLVLRAGGEGTYALFGLLILVWSTDIGAYFCGRLIGGPKLWPAVSPKKTWSGAVGGLAAAVFLSLLAAKLAGFQNLAMVAVLVAFLSAMSQLGDLGESALKRHFSVKDSGGIIPGHGGLMDRVDGLMLATVCAYAIGVVAGGIWDPTQLLAGLR